MSEAELPKAIGAYRIQGRLGQGAMGVVFKGVHETLERPAAVKLLPPELAQNPEYVSRFLREARVIATLRHDHIVQVYDAGAFEGKYFIAMELVEGTSLAGYLQEKNVLDEKEGVELLHQAAEGLAAAHAQGLVHRDIKPENLLLDQKGNLRIVDFGLVMESASTTQLTATGACLGTPMFMSPEQADGEKADERSDLYSLGITFYRALAGQVPFSSPTVMNLLFKHKFEAPPDPRKIKPGLSEDIANLLLTMMAKRREDRPQSAQKVVELIDGYRQGKKIPAPPPFQSPLDTAKTLVGAATPSGAASVPATGSRVLLWAGLAAALVFVAVGGVVLYFLFRSPPASTATSPGGGGGTKIDAGLQGGPIQPAQPEKGPTLTKRQELVQNAQKLERNGDLVLALAVYEKAAALGGAEELQPKIAELKAKLTGVAQPPVQPPVQPPGDQGAVTLAAQARLAEEAGQYDLAAQKYDEASKKADEAGKKQEYQNASWACRRKGYLKQAQDAETREDWPAAAAALSQALMLGKDKALEAKRDELMAKAKQADEFNTYVTTGNKLLAEGQYVAARANYQLALRIKPGNPEVNAKYQEAIGREAYQRAETARLAGNTSAARDDYQKALQLYPALRPLVEPRLAELDKAAAAAGANVDGVIAQVDQLVRDQRTNEAFGVLAGALRNNPQEARLLQVKSGLEGLQACEAIYRGLAPVLNKGQAAASDARRADVEDDPAQRYQEGFAAKARDCTEREAQVRARFLTRAYDAVRPMVSDAKTLALLSATDLQSAYERYNRKAKDAAEFKGVSAPFGIRLGVKGDKEKAEKYSRIAETFAGLTQQARALSQ